MRFIERRQLTVRGTVQGVGFRPFVFGLASRLALCGFVRNTTRGVLIEVEGERQALDRFESELVTSGPPLSQVDELLADVLPAQGSTSFRIEGSSTLEPAGGEDVRVTPDIATCSACLADLFDPSNRRYLYPFTTCAGCGPRLTIVSGAPYDRERTSMAQFHMCEACAREYENPLDRRFHAETVACSRCGPHLVLSTPDRRPIDGDPIDRLAGLLVAGRIGAVKGLGGYHLACDATNARAVSELRRRKHRDEKPFAVMFATLEAIETVCAVDRNEVSLLSSPARPIVLLERRDSPLGPHPAVAPGSTLIGAMLPSTPLHHLLIRAARRPLVMTSGNRSQEPMACDDDDARERLSDIADVFLTHDRAITIRCDDGVSRVAGGTELPIRRSRGQAPRPLRLPIPCGRPTLAAGGHMKNTFALGRGPDAILSHHIGDLDDYQALEAFRREIDLYQRLFKVAPEMIAHDAHPDYASTRYALERARHDDVETLSVQHHHAHVASCMAEHGLTDPVIGVAFDGSGYGNDGTIWGGEFLVGDARSVSRAAHLRAVGLPGGEQAVREPWRMAVAHLTDAGEDCEFVARRHSGEARLIEQMIARRVNTPLTSSAGRLFDAVAALAGVRDTVSFEGQAAMQLESLAGSAPDSGGYPFGVDETPGCLVIDTRPLVRAAAADARSGTGIPIIARRFHTSLADMVADVCGRVRTRTGVNVVVLTGGVFLNVRLTLDCVSRLSAAGFGVYRHQQVPPGDGGLSLGQLVVAAASGP